MDCQDSPTWIMPAEWHVHECCWMLLPYRTDNWRSRLVGGVRETAALGAFLKVAQTISRFEKVRLGIHPVALQHLLCETDPAEQQHQQCSTVRLLLKETLASFPNISTFTIEYDDSWMRDTGPTFLIRGPSSGGGVSIAGINWKFNAWGGKCSWGKDDTVASAIIDILHEEYKYSNAAKEGGNEKVKLTPNVVRIDARIFEKRELGGTKKEEGVVEAHTDAESLDTARITYSDADFVLEGGSIHTDGEGTVLVTEQCLLHPNRNPHLSRAQVEAALLRLLGAHSSQGEGAGGVGGKVVWLPQGLVADEDTDGHVDNLCCFARPGVVLLAWTDDEADEQHAVSREALQVLQASTDARGRPLQVVKLPLPPPLHYTRQECAGLCPMPAAGAEEGYLRQPGERMAASYVNFYLANGAVICPAFSIRGSGSDYLWGEEGEGDKGGGLEGEGEEREGDYAAAFDARVAAADAEAVRVLRQVFPKREVVQVPGCREILLGGGNIHCITQQQPRPS